MKNRKVLLRLRSLLDQGYPKGRSSFYEDIRAGLFPKGVAIGARARAWPSDEVDAVRDARIAGKSDDDIRALVKKLEAARKLIT